MHDSTNRHLSKGLVALLLLASVCFSGCRKAPRIVLLGSSVSRDVTSPAKETGVVRDDVTTPAKSIDLRIKAVARRFEWRFSYPGGPQKLPYLAVPSGAVIELTLSSEDVLHALAIPHLRLRIDVLPAHYSRLIFTAPGPGRYLIACAEYCGSGCRGMRTAMLAKTKPDFLAWLRNPPTRLPK